MKVLVATKETQGTRENDYYSDELRSSEIVVPPVSLRPGEFADDDDGFARCVYGIHTYQTTTTLKVLDIPVSVRELEFILADTLRREFPDLAANFDKRARVQIKRMLEIASAHRLGTVLEFRDNVENIRKVGFSNVRTYRR